MKLKILNKNLQIDDDYSSAKIYNVDEGCNITECYNETLDSGVFIISNITETDRIKIEPFDIVELLDDTNVRIRYMCVDTYTETMICVTPKLYKYEINLFSETKQLEGIVLPNLKITKMNGISRTIYYYINQYMEEYATKIRVVNGVTYKFDEKWNWKWTSSDDKHPSLEDKFSDECPEMQWNTPTLREVLNDLMMIKDCIPILKYGKLDYIDLTQVKHDISNNQYINYITRSKSSEDYVSELQVKLENVTNKTEGVNNIVTKTEWFTFNIPNDKSTMTTENVLVKTQYPIYNLKKLKVLVPLWFCYREISDDTNDNWFSKWVSFELTNFRDYFGNYYNLVYEYQNWITKNIAYNTFNPPGHLSDWPDYQNWTLCYKRGSNEITGFNNSAKFMWQTGIFWEELITKVDELNTPSGYHVVITPVYDHTPNLWTFVFEVEYETLEGCLFRASKNDAENTKIVIDNQTNSYVDSYSQGFLEYQKANRLGNEQLQINARYPLNYTGNMIEIGDMYEDSIIYQCQYQYFKDHTEINAIATKNYILREYFTGVKSKIRSWAIVSGSEALTRHDLEKYYCEFSYNKYVESRGLGELSTHNLGQYFISPLVSYTAEPLKCAFVRTVDDDGEFHPADLSIANTKPQDSYYYLDLMSRVIGNSLVFTFEFLDNFWVGQSIHTENDYNGNAPSRGNGENQEIYVMRSDIVGKKNNIAVAVDIVDSAKIGGGIPMWQHRYTDNNGEFWQLEVVFGTNMKVIPTFEVASGSDYVELYMDDVEDGTNTRPTPNSGNLNDQSQYFLYYIAQRPRVYESNFKWAGTHNYDVSKISLVVNHYKDSQEITNLSTQFEFCTDSLDICIGKEYLLRQEAINTNNNNVSNYKLIAYDKTDYNYRNPNELPLSDAEEEMSINISTLSGTNENLNRYINIVLPFNYSTSEAAKAKAKELAEDYCFYLNDGASSTNKILLAFNNIPEDNCIEVADNNVWHPAFRLYLNILKVRNKNIYDDEDSYLINSKMSYN